VPVTPSLPVAIPCLSLISASTICCSVSQGSKIGVVWVLNQLGQVLEYCNACHLPASQEPQATDRAQSSKNPSARGREEGNKDKGIATRRRRRARTSDGKRSLSPRVAPLPPHAMSRTVASPHDAPG
jgi:hypothetical protein